MERSPETLSHNPPPPQLPPHSIGASEGSAVFGKPGHLFGICDAAGAQLRGHSGAWLSNPSPPGFNLGVLSPKNLAPIEKCGEISWEALKAFKSSPPVWDSAFGMMRRGSTKKTAAGGSAGAKLLERDPSGAREEKAPSASPHLKESHLTSKKKHIKGTLRPVTQRGSSREENKAARMAG